MNSHHPIANHSEKLTRMSMHWSHKLRMMACNIRYAHLPHHPPLNNPADRWAMCVVNIMEYIRRHRSPAEYITQIQFYSPEFAQELGQVDWLTVAKLLGVQLKPVELLLLSRIADPPHPVRRPIWM